MSVPAPRPETASNPHDAYTQSVFRELPQALGFFRGYLADEVQELFDWRTLRLETGSFLSDQLQRGFADLRFSIRFTGQQRAHRITLLFEHKHRVVYTAPRQPHRYISRQLEETPDGNMVRVPRINETTVSKQSKSMPAQARPTWGKNRRSIRLYLEQYLKESQANSLVSCERPRLR